MRHTANMGPRDLICSGHRVPSSSMTEADLAWCRAHPDVIAQGADGRWYHTKITDRDRATRASFWRPDTGHRHE